jgi:hypothetical protein
VTGFGVILSENPHAPVGSVVRLGQVELQFKIDISETNAGPRWIPNPNSQFVLAEENKMFVIYAYDYQIISVFDIYEGADLESTLSKFEAK